MSSGRLPIVATLIVSLLVAGTARQWADNERSTGPGSVPRSTSGAAALSRMNSYALALLLGGLRGPLVMILWPSAEQQKQEKNLEDFDTKIEWIRLLQAEFDTVHIFQIWNKAYNVSVQLSSLSNKYRAILDALDYGQKVDQERPNNLNIISAIAGVYFDKLGNSAEKSYYRQRIRQESRARTDMMRIAFPASQRADFTRIAAESGASSAEMQFSEDVGEVISVTLPKSVAEPIQAKFSGPGIAYTDRPSISRRKDDPGWRRTEFDPILDAQGNLLADEYLHTRNPRPADLAPTSEWNDGSELQYLKQYEPFPYGVSPLALGYNYYKRAQVLMTVSNQKSTTLSDNIINTRPAIALEFWSVEEWERARRAEVEGFDKPIPDSRGELELATANISLKDPIVRKARIQEAIFSCDRGRRLAEDGIRELQRHLQKAKSNVTIYQSHIDEMIGEADLLAGDSDYLRLMLDPTNAAVKQSAVEHYAKATTQYQLIILQYYCSDELAEKLFPQGVTRANIAQRNLPPGDIASLLAKVQATFPAQLDQMEGGDFIEDFLRYIERARIRSDHLKA